MTTDINQLISPNIPWRQREARFEKAFPQFELIVAVVDAPTPELVDEATNALAANGSRRRRICFTPSNSRKAGRFFAQNGLLFEPIKDLEPQMKVLAQAQRLVQVLAGDPIAARRHPGTATQPARRAGRPDYARQHDVADDARRGRDRERQCRQARELFLARNGSGPGIDAERETALPRNSGHARITPSLSRASAPPMPCAKPRRDLDIASKYQARRAADRAGADGRRGIRHDQGERRAQRHGDDRDRALHPVAGVALVAHHLRRLCQPRRRARRSRPRSA